VNWKKKKDKKPKKDEEDASAMSILFLKIYTFNIFVHF